MLPENCTIKSINSGWSCNKESRNRCFKYCLEATPNDTLDNNEGIYEAGETAISNACRTFDESYAHRGKITHLLLDYFGSDKDLDSGVAVFAKNELICARLHERESKHKREAAQDQWKWERWSSE